MRKYWMGHHVNVFPRRREDRYYATFKHDQKFFVSFGKTFDEAFQEAVEWINALLRKEAL